MKKTLLASAIAAATFSGSALAMENAAELAARMDSMPSVYGNIQYVVKHTNVEDGSSELEHADNGSTLGIKHDHEIAPGVTGFFKLELEGIGADNKSTSNGIDSLDEAYIGARGDFGQVWIGSDDGTYERAVVKIGNFHEVGSAIFSAGTTGEGDQIQYMSPSFGGLTLGASLSVYGDGETSTTIDSPVSVTDGELDTTTTNNDKSFPYQLSATYEVDALTVAFAMDSNEAASGSNENTYGLAATYNAGDLSLVGEFQTRSDDKDIIGVMATYTMGANQFNAAYQMQDNDDDSERTVLTLQALHNLSDHMYVYAEGYLQNDEPDGGDDTDTTIGAVGAVYYF